MTTSVIPHLLRCILSFYLLLPALANASDVQKMQSMAEQFLSSLDVTQRQTVMFAFNDSERENWAYVPKSREGLALLDLNDAQEINAFSLLRASLSASGYKKAQGVIALEAILGELTNKPEYRDPKKYYLSIFGDIKARNWGWRFEGHHLSLNFTVIDGKLTSVAPLFLGANPATVPSGKRQGWQLLKAEERAARKLLNSLNKAQKKKAIIAKDAYKEILTRSKKTVRAMSLEGLAYAKANKKQKKLFLNLIDVYLKTLPGTYAKHRKKLIETNDINALHFAWAGSETVGERHYFRLQGESFLMEYVNAQNNANHAHTVWREFDNDFGRDVLKQHLEKHEH